MNDLYFGLDMMRNYAPVYWWFLSDGRALYGLPTSGLTPADFEAACGANPSVCGKYSLSGDKLAITYRNGKTENYTYKPLQGGMQLNYIIYTPVKKFPAGTRLNGAWSKPYSATVVTSSTSGVQVTSPTFITFRPDGTFSYANTIGIDTVSNVKGANVTSSQSTQASGTYTIQDFVLTWVKNGKSERHMIFPAPGDNLNIDGSVYTKQAK